MKRLATLTALAFFVAGCDDEELPESPPYAVPGQQVTQPPEGQQPVGMPPMQMGAAPPTYDPALAVPGQPSPLPLAQPQMPPGMQPGQMPPGMQPGQMPPGMQPGQMQPGQMPPGQMPPGQMPPGMQPGQMPPGQAPISLATGFMPDPQTARGVASGEVAAFTITQAESCSGFVPSQPGHVVALATSFSNLRILVSSQIDTVLVVRQPDGTFLCNDDTVLGQNVNPTIQGQFMPGTYTLWVGTYSQGATGNYVIGFTELSHVTHESLGS